MASPIPASSAGRAGSRARGELRHQFAHAIDVLPTLLELIGVDAPAEIGGIAQSDIEGTSFAYLLDDADAPERHTVQYFEMLGSRGLYQDGWKAVTFKPLGAMYDDGLDPDAPFDDDEWELYDVRVDPSETHDLAAEEPDRLAAMIDRWWEEARKYQVLPLDNRPVAALMAPRRPFQDRPAATYFPSHAVGARGERDQRARPHRTSCARTSTSPPAVRPAACCSRWARCSAAGRSTLLDGRLRYVSNYLGRDVYVVESDVVVPPGAPRADDALRRPPRLLRHRARSSSTARRSAPARSRAPRRSATRSAAPASPAAGSRARRSVRVTPRRSPSRVRCTASRSRSSAPTVPPTTSRPRSPRS